MGISIDSNLAVNPPKNSSPNHKFVKASINYKTLNMVYIKTII